MLIATLGAAVSGAELDPRITDSQTLSKEAEARSIGGESLVRLVRYRADVERGAYRETIDLCAGYAFGQDLTGGHPPQFSWSKILGHGFIQPLSLLSVPGHEGLKATYNDVTQTRVWQFDAWLRSVHTLYLVKSPGFQKAARECLGSDERAVARFAFAVNGADVLGSLVSGELIAIPVSYGLSALVRQTTRWWSKLVPPRLARRGFQAAMVALTPVAAYNLVEYIRNLKNARAAARSILNDGWSERERVRASGRRMLMARVVTELHAALEANTLSQFETWAAKHVTAADRRSAHEDYAKVIAETERAGSDEEYRLVLKAILPVLDQIRLN